MKIADGQFVDMDFLLVRGLMGRISATLDGVEQDLAYVESINTGPNGSLNIAATDREGNLFLDENGDIARVQKRGHVIITVVEEAKQ